MNALQTLIIQASLFGLVEKCTVKTKAVRRYLIQFNLWRHLTVGLYIIV